jgi:CBS domain containing-hemolysin-like protein
MLSTLIWVLAATLATSFLCSILEAVLLSITHSHVVMLQERGDAAGNLLDKMRRKIDEPIAAILTLNTIANTLGATIAGALALEVFGKPWMAAFSGALTLAILLFSEIVPKTVGATFWPQLSRPSAWILRVMIVVMKPVLVPLSAFARMMSGNASRPSISRSELEILAEIGRREGTLDESEWKVVSNVIRLDEVTVAEVMTPRTDIVAVPVDATLGQAKDLMLDDGHLRLPVFEGSTDRIVGILLARDLWRADRAGGGEIRDIMRPPLFAPSGKPVEDLIPEMRVQRNKMAIVVDEFGGTAGLVTLEDLIEEIIGEIQDEHEADEPEDFYPLDDDRTRIWGGVSVREVSDRLGIDLPEEPHDTLGGFLFGQLSRVARVGDVVDQPEGAFRITRVRGRRIEYAVWQPKRSGGAAEAR